jgi:nucleoside triphosphate diphosphatase
MHRRLTIRDPPRRSLILARFFCGYTILTRLAVRTRLTDLAMLPKIAAGYPPTTGAVMALSPPDGRGIDRLLAIMAQLRHPEGGCPWDLEQNFRSIAPYTIEEAYEVADAIERNDLPALKDELGDLLLQVVFHGRMAEEQGEFGFEEIAAHCADKMVRRHPHVFGTATGVATAADQTASWESLKAAERAAAATGQSAPSVLDGVTIALPALTRAVKIQRRAARVGFDWDRAAPILDKIAEEVGELGAEIAAGAGADRLEDELGDLLFAVTNLARRLELDPETALRRATGKFERRFRRIESLLAARQQRMEEQDLAALELLWRQVKREERDGAMPTGSSEP